MSQPKAIKVVQPESGPEVPADLATRLELATNAVLAEIFASYTNGKLPEAKHWAVNWGDLSCVHVVLGTRYSGGEAEPYTEVLVEEVAPGDGIQAEIAKRLTVLGFDNVQVRTEW